MDYKIRHKSGCKFSRYLTAFNDVLNKHCKNLKKKKKRPASSNKGSNSCYVLKKKTGVMFLNILCITLGLWVCGLIALYVEAIQTF